MRYRAFEVSLLNRISMTLTFAPRGNTKSALTADFVPNWEFTNKLAIYESATFSFRIIFFRFARCHALLNHKRIAVIRPPLFMKWCHAEAAAIGDDIANPLRLQWTGTCSAFSAGYQSP
jgi:hypothetical protein